MRKKTFSEGRIALALREAETGTPVTEVCRQMGVSEQSFYRWKKKYMGMEIAELRRLRQECLNQHWFASLEDARITVEAWRIDYNGQRPHTALGNQTPEQFEPEWQLSGTAQKRIF